MTTVPFHSIVQGFGRAARAPAVVLALLLGAGLFAAGLLATPAAAQEAGTLPAPTQGVFDAVMKNDLVAVRRSVEAGADVTLRNTRGLTPAEFAVEIGNIEIANYLLAQERIQVRAQQAAKDRPRTQAKSAKTVAQKSEPARAKAPDEPQGAAQDKDRGETKSASPDRALPAEPDAAKPKRPGGFFRWIAGLMTKDDEPAPPAKPEESKTTKPEEPKTAQPEKPKAPTPAPTAKAKATPAKKAAEPLPPPDRERQRSRNFFEWLADNMAGREARSVRRPKPPEALDEPPSLSERDPWAAKIVPTMPPTAAPTTAAAPTPAPAELAQAKPEAVAPPPEPPPPVAALPATPEQVPGETAPGSWAPTIEHGGTTPAPDSQIAAVPDGSASPDKRDLLFSGPGAAPKAGTPKAAAKKPDPKPSEGGGGLFGMSEPQGAAKDKDADGGLWGSKVEMAQGRPIAGAPPPGPPIPENVPVGLGFMVGRSLNLDKSDPPRGNDPAGTRSCVEKSRGQVLFCVEVANWPKAMEAAFTVNTILYTGQQAVVRYDRNRATRIQTLFPSESFDRVAAYYTGLYGPPTEAWTRSIAPLAVARRENPTQMWRARNPKTNEIATLEIRKFDDTRGGFPDTKRGVVMLYYNEASPIFPQVSALELMRLKRPPIGQPEKTRSGG